MCPCRASGLIQRQSKISSRLISERRAALSDEYGAKLVFGAGGVELGVILEFEQELQIAAYPQLLGQAPPGGVLHALRSARMAAAAIRPI